MKNFKKKYRDLETQVMSSLRDKINKSKFISKHINEKSIKVNVFDYTELTVINDRLTFLDKNGQQYSLFADCSLEDLIDILTPSNKKVVIESLNLEDKFDLYDEAGQCIESLFNSYKEAETWAKDNGYEVVESFNL